MRERIASLISGGGSTMSELAKACFSGRVAADMVCVVSSSREAKGCARARDAGVPEKDVVVVDPDDYRPGAGEPVDQSAFGHAILKELQTRNVTAVFQNGWMPLTPELLIEAFRDKIFNQHPGPLPEFGGKGMYGRRVHAAVLLFRRMTKTEPWTQVVAQRVANEFDAGSVLLARQVPIMPNDTVDDLQNRALPVEHTLQIELLEALVAEKLQPLPPRKGIVTPETEEALQFAKRAARLLFPKG